MDGEMSTRRGEIQGVGWLRTKHSVQVNYSLFDFMGNLNDGVGGFGAGMEKTGGSFRLNTTRGFSPKIYAPTGNGSYFYGNQYTKVSSMKNWGRGLGWSSLGLGIIITSINVTIGAKEDGWHFGYNAQKATFSGIGGMIGAYIGGNLGAAAGALITSETGGWGAIVGGAAGSVVGGIRGAQWGEYVFDNYIW
jgi:hypothetical protein